jgi:ABC-2 type transport system ATP-binding protein
VIELTDLRREFTAERSFGGLGRRSGPALEALRGVSLSVAAGERVGIAGANGSGKSSLLRIAAGLLTPTAGDGSVGGVELSAGPHELAKVAALVAGEERSFYWRVSGRHNLELWGALRGMRPTEARERARQLLEHVGLADAGERRVQTYSSGMRQRLAMARALLGRPRVLLCDELTRALDEEGTERLWALATEESEGGAALLTTATRLDDLEGRCDRILFLDGGRLVDEPSAEVVHA